MQLTVAQVLAFRVGRQFLVEPADDALEVVRRLAGIQAQVPSAAEASAACRVAHAGPRQLDALADGRAIRTWAMRGTLHVLAAEDAPAYLALLAASRSWERPVWQRSFITTAQLAVVAAVAAAGGDAALAEHLRSGWGTVLKPLA